MAAFMPIRRECVILVVIVGLLAMPFTAWGEAGAAPAAGAADVDGRVNQAVPKGLHWLVEQQNGRGQFVDAKAAQPDEVAYTALAGLALLASGGEPDKGEYGKPLRAAVDAVLASQQGSGLFTVSDRFGPMYGHGYATLFLAEAYRKHPEDAVKKALEKSVELLRKSASAEGGWRYSATPRDADISVTACELNALLATRAAGIAVDGKLIDNATQYVRRCQNADGGFSYMAGQGAGSGFPRSAAGVAVLLHGGARPATDDDLRRGIEFVSRVMRISKSREGHYFYGCYYASQWMAADPAAHEAWAALAREVLDAQQADGSWKGDFSAIYATASALLILEAPQKQLWIFR